MLNAAQVVQMYTPLDINVERVGCKDYPEKLVNEAINFFEAGSSETTTAKKFGISDAFFNREIAVRRQQKYRDKLKEIA